MKLNNLKTKEKPQKGAELQPTQDKKWFDG